MSHAAISSIVVLCVLALFSAVALFGDRDRDRNLVVCWGATFVASVYWAWSRDFGLGLTTALLGNVVATQIAFGTLLFRHRDAIRLAVVLGPYLALTVGLVIWSSANIVEDPLGSDLSIWLILHIVCSLLAYGLVTIGAVAGLATIVKDGALKRRQRSRISEQLPSVASSSKIEIVGLTSAELVLGLGIIFGVAAEFVATGQFFVVSHKSLFSLFAFLLIGGLLFLHLRSGIKGRFAARLGLTAYLLVSLGYPGVKFVTDILIT